MVPINSADDGIKVIAALLSDVQTLHSNVFDQSALRKTIQKIVKRCAQEGMGFLTKTLPRLGKALDRALTSECSIDANQLAFKSMPNSKLPIFMGELFELVFTRDGLVKPDACVLSIRSLRTVCYLFYKYKLPYNSRQEQDVLDLFEKTEEDISHHHELFCTISERIQELSPGPRQISTFNSSSYTKAAEVQPLSTPPMSEKDALNSILNPYWSNLVRDARSLLRELFEHFDATDITPRHGPGTVSTKERLWGKWTFSNVPQRIANLYPPELYYRASIGHACDTIRELNATNNYESSARVLLVQKDSRGPRLISAEPLEFQYIQQGLGRAIMKHVESHHLTRDNVFFTKQQPNQFGALLGSATGRYSTLDLKEASDRVTVGLVRLLFPDTVQPYLLACRSLSTRLPNGKILKLKKFAPMGSALCFPIMALTIWSILTAGMRNDTYSRERVLVYGDDVIVTTAQAVNAMEHLEAFGLKINRAKSCVSGFFRESCGKDAYKGVDVTPLRFRKVLPSHPDPESFVSLIETSNRAYDRKYYTLYGLLAERLYSLYGSIPSDALRIAAPSLREVPTSWKPLAKRSNPHLQKMEYLVLMPESQSIRRKLHGWKMLHRYFCEGTSAQYEQPNPDYLNPLASRRGPTSCDDSSSAGFMVDQYTERGGVTLRRRWR